MEMTFSGGLSLGPRFLDIGWNLFKEERTRLITGDVGMAWFDSRRLLDHGKRIQGNPVQEDLEMQVGRRGSSG